MVSAISRWKRLERLRALLSTGEPATTRELAAAVGIGQRTLVRDIDMLRDMGVLIDADRGRGGGLRIASGHNFARVNLDAEEAIDVLIAMALAEGLCTPLKAANLRSARQKLVGGFAARDREVIRRLRRRILVGQAASARIAKSFESDQGRHNEEIRSAFFNWRLLAVVYRDERGRSTSRVIEPHYLLLNAPAWYVLAWDRLRDAVRAFRTDRIVRAEVIEGRFGVRSAAPFMQAAEHVETL